MQPFKVAFMKSVLAWKNIGLQKLSLQYNVHHKGVRETFAQVGKSLGGNALKCYLWGFFGDTMGVGRIGVFLRVSMVTLMEKKVKHLAS